MEKKIIDTYLEAKKETMAINIFLCLACLSLTTLIVLESLDINHDYTILLATMSMVFTMIPTGKNRWVSISRGVLIDQLGKIIRDDPDAIKTLARKNK